MHIIRSIPLVLLFGLALSSVAGAQEPDPRKSPNWETAHKYHEVAQQLYNIGNYSQALTEFKKAYELAPLPELLHNIGRCHELLAQLEEAVKHYRLYLDKKKDTPNRLVLQARIKNLEKRIAQQKAAQPPPAPAPVAKPEPAPVAKPEPTPVLKPVPAPTPITPDPEPAPPRTWRFTAGWVGVGVGAAALVTGIAFGALASGKASEYEDAASDGKTTFQELADLGDQGQTYETAQTAALISGAVIGLAGAGLLVWEMLLDKEEDGTPAAAVLLPYVGPNGGGVAGIIRF